jgi:hypothetical protein
VLDLLHAPDVAVHVVDDALELGAQLCGRRHVLRRQPVVAAEARRLVGIQGEESHEVGAAVAHHHGLGHQVRGLEAVLEVRGRHVLAPRRDDEVLLAARDVEEAVGVEVAQVARAQPGAVEGQRGALRVPEVGLEDVGSAHVQLAVRGEAGLHAGQHAAHGAEAVVGRGVQADRGGGLREAVGLHHLHPAGVEELEDLHVDGGGAGDRLAQATSEQVAHAPQDQAIGQGVLGPQQGPRGSPRALAAAHLAPHPDRPREGAGLQATGLLGPGVGEGVHLLEHAWDRGEVGRAHLADVGDDGLAVALPVGDGRADVERDELDRQREAVGERQEQEDGLGPVDHPVLLDLRHDAAVVGVREHASLRRARRARGVDDHEGVLGRDRGDALVELGRLAPAPAPAQLRPGKGADEGRRRVDHDDVPQLRQLRLAPTDLGELLRVLHHDRHGLRVLERVAGLRGGVGLVDRDGDSSRARDPEVGLRPLGARVGEDGDPLVGLQAEVHEPEGDLAHDRREVRVGRLAPCAALLVQEGGGRGMRGGGPPEQVRHRVGARALHGPRRHRHPRALARHAAARS